MTRRRVLVTGARGQLGAAIVRAFEADEVLARTRETLDITSPEAVAREVASARPDVIVNCAAFNDVDGAEDRPEEALAANAFALRSLARAADAAGSVLVHYGTDFVFDGNATEPYNETSAPSPRSVYAASKLLGEWFALEAAAGFVLRVESLFGTPDGWTGRLGTLDRMVQALRDGREVVAFTDRIVSPSAVDDIAAATKHLVDRRADPGLYHCVNSGSGSWHDVAMTAARLLGVTPRIRPVTTADVTMRASRPRYCALSNARLAAAGFEMPTWEDALRRSLAGTARLQGEKRE